MNGIQLSSKVDMSKKKPTLDVRKYRQQRKWVAGLIQSFKISNYNEELRCIRRSSPSALSESMSPLNFKKLRYEQKQTRLQVAVN